MPPGATKQNDSTSDQYCDSINLYQIWVNRHTNKEAFSAMNAFDFFPFVATPTAYSCMNGSLAAAHDVCTDQKSAGDVPAGDGTYW